MFYFKLVILKEILWKITSLTSKNESKYKPIYLLRSTIFLIHSKMDEFQNDTTSVILTVVKIVLSWY